MLKTILVLLLLAEAAYAQPQMWTGGGVFYNSDATVNVTGVTAKQISEFNSYPIYVFVGVTVSNTQQVIDDIAHHRPTAVLTTEESGACQSLPWIGFGKVPVYQCGTVGVAQANVTQTQVDFSSSVSLYTMVPIGIGKNTGMFVIPVFKWNRNGLQPKNWSAGVMIGWGR